MNDDILYAMKQAQMQRALGELKALNMLYYQSNSQENIEYNKLKDMISNFEEVLTDNFS